ncbi:MAG: biopolymer transporter ExbD [Proteobacteria bacterium]|nr:biopolymer transporter ExbD [Pseudomonadota bacterium]
MAIGKLHDVDVEGTEESLFAEINITPLTDVFLVLLIIFIVSAAAALQHEKEKRELAEQEIAEEKRSGLKINLPSGTAREVDPTAKSIIVTILPNGQIFVNDTEVDEKQLDNIFRSAFSRNKNTQVVLKADAGVHHGRVVGVMEKAKRIGLTKLAIATSGG